MNQAEKEELLALRAENAALKQEIFQLKQELTRNTVPNAEHCQSPPAPAKIQKLSNNQIQRYSRQLILANFGTKGQVALSNCSMVIIGAGGIGSPAALYLAAAGVGTIGIVDHDTVDISNLHRQIAHSEASHGTAKSESACDAIRRLNSSVRCVSHNTLITSSNALDIIRPYDIVLDASDNVATRYLISDACVMLSKPLISASALRFEGQATVYNYQNGPCYRCLFPTPPPVETVSNCSDVGVLGVIPGVVGCIQALEAIKVAIGAPASETLSSKLLMFDGLNCIYRVMKLRGKNVDCVACGPKKMEKLIDYELWCGSPANDSVELFQTMRSLSHYLSSPLPLVAMHCLQIGRCPVADIPLKELPEKLDEVKEKASARPVYVICRRGVDSVTATHLLLQHHIEAFDVAGGLRDWSSSVDPEFPRY